MPILLIGIVFACIMSAFLMRTATRLYRKKYGQHIVFEEDTRYKIGWRSMITPTFIATCILNLVFWLVSIYFFFVASCADHASEFMSGLLITLFCSMCARELAAIIVFQHAIHHPNDISGTTHIKTPLVNKIVFASHLSLFIPLVALTIAFPAQFMIGACMAIAFFILTSFTSAFTTIY